MTAESSGLDEIDQRIVALLAQSGRLTNRKLANAIGLSASACLDRVRRLEATGVILGYRALIATECVGGRLEGWADIRLIDPSPEATIQFTEMVRTTPAIVEAHRTAGQYDYALRFLGNDLEQWRKFQALLGTLDCQVQSRFSVFLGALK